MNTAAMVITISGFSLIFIPGLFGWIGVVLGIIGVTMAIIGLTNVKTSPSGLGMDVASWIYSMVTVATGFGCQIKYAAGALDALMLPLSIQNALIFAGVLFPVFVFVQIFARKKMRIAGIAAALLIYFIICAAGWTSLVLADRAGISIV